MYKFEKYSIHPVGAGFLVLIITFVLYQVVGGLLTYFFVGVNITEENVKTVRLLTSISQIVFLLIITILFAKIIYNDFENVFKISKPNLVELLVAFFGLFFLVISSQSFLYLQENFLKYLANSNASVKSLLSVLDEFDKVVEESYKKMINAENNFEFVAVVLSVALIPAFCEEFLFRGFVLTSFEQKLKPFWAISLSGIIFGVFHFNPYAIVPLIALGIYFSYLASASGSIFIPVILHFINNFLTVSLYYIFKSSDLIKSRVETSIPTSMLIIGFFSTIFLFIFTVLTFNKLIAFRKQKNYGE
ncbi:MAG: CPBP family intramembrane metalloprotease [Ignavibacteria bacterium]|nr:CPBP family intramembrane metalloprotease [Ignavibacteria bacterium]